MKTITLAGLSIALSIGSLSCAERTPSGPDEQIENPLPFLNAPAGVFVSNPHGSAGGIAYVSAVRETFPGTLSVAVRNETKHGATNLARIVDGGFDPVPVEAIPGDRISLTFSVTTGGSSSALVSVPQRLAPAAVRMDPSDGEKNVAVNVHFFVVFSEPVDKSSVNATSIALLDDFDLVPGQVQVSLDGLRAEFVPDQPLEWGKQYSLNLEVGVRDLDGEPLASRSVSTFETLPASASTMELVFTRETDRQIYRVGMDGNGMTPLTHTGQNVRPVWSPNGNRIAFARYENGKYTGDIYTMDADGSNVVRRTVNANLWSAVWSPDGSKLAVSDEGVYDGSIWIINADDDGARPNLIAAEARTPAWSPDGKQIAFVRLSGDDGYHQIFLMNADGTDVRPVTEFDSGGIYGLSWSPDGKRLAFSKCLQGICGLYTISPDGSQQNLVTSLATAGGADWSPDGQQIAFTINNYSGGDWLPSVAYVRADGGQVHIIADGFWPSWRRK